MPASVRPRLTYANVMATIAVFLALGGGAYAAIRLPANSVGTRQIRNGAVTPAMVAAATITRFKGATGAPGAPGPQGPLGAQGPKGDPGATSLKVRAAAGTGRVTVACQSGERATGGGAHSLNGSITASAPAADPDAIYTTGGISYQEYAPTSWTAAAEGPGGSPADVTAWVVCATP